MIWQIQQKLNDPKIVMYFVHDTNIAQFLITLNQGLNLNITYNYTLFASNIIIEFSNAYKNMYFIEIFYNGNSLYKDNYKNFKIMLNSALISCQEISTFCSLNIENNLNIYLIAIVCLGVYSLILMIALTIFYIKYKQTIFQGIN